MQDTNIEPWKDLKKLLQNLMRTMKLDPRKVDFEGKQMPFNLLYGQRMSTMMDVFEPDAEEILKLAARCQHIGRWEIPRSDFPMDRKGYLKWRSQLKIHHANVAEKILSEVGYEQDAVNQIRDLLMKKQLKQNPMTQTLEDVICLVFLEYYIDDFSKAHDQSKLVEILRKTILKMSSRGVEEALKLPLSEKTRDLIAKASTP